MNAIIALIVAAIPQAIISIASKLFTADLLQAILTKIILLTLKKLAALSTNTIDDEVVKDIEQHLTAKQQ